MADGSDNPRQPEVGVQLIKRNLVIAKGDADSNALTYEDEFKGYYTTDTLAGRGASVVAPPFTMRLLEGLVQHNNALQSCIDAVVTNVHGTGYAINLKDVGKDASTDPTTDPDVQVVTDFFSEVWPKTTFLQLRKQLGRDVEVFGIAYVEVIRNMRGQMMMLRRIDPKTMRICRLGNPIETPITVMRGTTPVTIKTNMRFRRFAQVIGPKLIYFKEYGCPLDIDKTNGLFSQDPLSTETLNKIQLIAQRKLGSEILMFGKVPDVETSYTIPCWLPQLPSVLGSRKAEEFNLDYFDNGGVPPFMIFVQGGAMAQRAKDDLSRYLSSSPGAKQGVPVFEAYASGGSIDAPGNVRVTVERFGTERQKDSMFEGYDGKCEERIRRAWRLPPMFVGSAKDYTFATAYASYTVAEAQVFQPMRQDFDDLINATLMRELDPKGKCTFHSEPLSVNDITNQLVALELAINARAITPSELLKEINRISALNLKVAEKADDNFSKVSENMTIAPPPSTAASNPIPPKKPTPSPPQSAA